MPESQRTIKMQKCEEYLRYTYYDLTGNKTLKARIQNADLYSHCFALQERRQCRRKYTTTADAPYPRHCEEDFDYRHRTFSFEIRLKKYFLAKSTRALPTSPSRISTKYGAEYLMKSALFLNFLPRYMGIMKRKLNQQLRKLTLQNQPKFTQQNSLSQKSHL